MVTKESPSANPSDLLDRRLFAVVVALLLVLVAIFGLLIHIQWRIYSRGIEAAVSSPTNHSAVLAYARAMDFGVAKTSSVFLGFAMVFSGILYVLRTADAVYKLDFTTASSKAALSTASPGLVVTTLGAGVVLVSVLNKSALAYAPETSLLDMPQREQHQGPLATCDASSEGASDARAASGSIDHRTNQGANAVGAPLDRAKPSLTTSVKDGINATGSHVARTEAGAGVASDVQSSARRGQTWTIPLQRAFQTNSLVLTADGADEVRRLCEMLSEATSGKVARVQVPATDGEYGLVLARRRGDILSGEFARCAPSVRFTVMGYGEAPATADAMDENIVIDLES